METARPFPFLS